MNLLLSAMNQTFRLQKSAGARVRTGQGKARRQRLCLEVLEDRTVPTAVAAPTGLLSWWAGDGNASDRVGPNAGTLSKGVTFAAAEVASGFSFNGSNYVSANTSGLPTGSSDRTLEMWVKINSFGTGESFFAGYGAFGSSNQTYHLGALSDHRLFFSQWGQAVTGPALQAGPWYHIAVTNTGNTATLYLNGAAVGSAALTIATPSNSTFYIGRIPGSLGSSRQLNGMVDEVSVYNRALSPGEIQGIYIAGSDGKIIDPITVDNPSVVEGSAGTTTTATFTVTRTGSLTSSLTVNYVTANAGSDYVATSGSITFAPGDTSKTVQVTVNGDNTSEPDETFKLVLTPAVGVPIAGVATILNDDFAFNFTSFNSSNASNLNLLGLAAVTSDNKLRLTTSQGGTGGTWYVAEKSLVAGNFSTTFQFQLYTGSGGADGSDGFAFVIQNSSPTELRGGGGALGYDGMPNSVAVEFDTFQNSENNDPSQSHISVHTNGTGPNSVNESVTIHAIEGAERTVA